MSEEVGLILGGKYKILNIVGTGGMSVVYLAWDEKLNRNWAIKKIKKSGLDEEKNVVENSAEMEITLLKKFDHMYLPRIVDLFETETSIYIVMDYIEGRSLLEELQERKNNGEWIPEDEVLKWGQQLCMALNYLHTLEEPIIYRDMKPSNVMLKPDGDIKIIDFGISRTYKDGNEGDTKALGTPGYHPPEQGFGAFQKQTDARSDIYALGMTLHHLLSGEDPTAANYKYEPIRNFRSDVSQAVEEIIDKCTAFDQEERYQNCDLLLYDLQHPELVGAEIKRSNKRKLTVFFALGITLVVMLAIGIAGLFLSQHENDKDYENKINIATSTTYEEKIQNYIEAIELYNYDTRAYLKLIQAYKDNGVFGDTENSQFMSLFNVNKEGFDQESAEYKDLLYETGIAYLYLYSGGDNTFRTRILKAYPYFLEIVESSAVTYENYSISEVYKVLGEFYSQYVIDATSVKEPTLESYEELLLSLSMSIDNMEQYNYDDAAYIRLTMYREIANLLNDHRQGLAMTGVELDTVIELLNLIMENTEELAVTQQASIEIQESILVTCEEYIENIERSYLNTDKRS